MMKRKNRTKKEVSDFQNLDISVKTGITENFKYLISIQIKRYLSTNN